MTVTRLHKDCSVTSALEGARGFSPAAPLLALRDRLGRVAEGLIADDRVEAAVPVIRGVLSLQSRILSLGPYAAGPKPLELFTVYSDALALAIDQTPDDEAGRLIRLGRCFAEVQLERLTLIDTVLDETDGERIVREARSSIRRVS